MTVCALGTAKLLPSSNKKLMNMHSGRTVWPIIRLHANRVEVLYAEALAVLKTIRKANDIAISALSL
jgi:hypothetical protein